MILMTPAAHSITSIINNVFILCILLFNKNCLAEVSVKIHGIPMHP
jgi:hypothetical protein